MYIATYCFGFNLMTDPFFLFKFCFSVNEYSIQNKQVSTMLKQYINIQKFLSVKLFVS